MTDDRIERLRRGILAERAELHRLQAEHDRRVESASSAFGLMYVVAAVILVFVGAAVVIYG